MYDKEYSTVNDAIKQLEGVRDSGGGNKILTINMEYYFSKPSDKPEYETDEICDFCDYYVI